MEFEETEFGTRIIGLKEAINAAEYWNLTAEQVRLLADRLERLETDNTAMRQRLERLVEITDNLIGRMDRARSILSDGTPNKNWGMLDTTLDIQAIAAAKSK
jgi:hypothetical protein